MTPVQGWSLTYLGWALACTGIDPARQSGVSDGVEKLLSGCQLGSGTEFLAGLGWTKRQLIVGLAERRGRERRIVGPLWGPGSCREPPVIGVQAWVAALAARSDSRFWGKGCPT